MFEGWRKETWDHTSSLMALLSNIHSGKNAKRVHPLDVHPYRKRAALMSTAAEWSSACKQFAAVFSDKKGEQKPKPKPKRKRKPKGKGK